MSEYRQNPDSNQHARHARPPQGAAPQAPQQFGAYRPASGAQPGAYRPATAHNRTTNVKAAAVKKGNSPGKKGGPWRVVFWIALVVLVVSLAALAVIGFGYWQGQQTYNKVAEESFTPPSDIEGTSLADFTVDWDALKAINPETVAWIYIPGTSVNYPIVHPSNNEKYLKTNFQGETNWVVSFGAIFLAAENAGDFTDANNIVYGHNMNDGSMFSTLADFENADAFEGHRTVYLLTPQGNYELSTFSLVHCDANDPLAQTVFASTEERVGYVQDKIDRSVVSATDIPAAADMTQTFTFSTCDNLPTDGRWVLFSYVVNSTVASDQTAAPDPDALTDAQDPEAVDAAAQALAS